MANLSGQLTLLPAKTITAALNPFVTDAFKFGAAFPKVITAQATFTYGSAGTTCKAWLQTSLDDGASWIDVACFSFTTASARKIAAVNNFVAITGAAVVVPTDGTLAADAIVNGVLGRWLRVKVITTGTYADSTTLAILAQVR